MLDMHIYNMKFKKLSHYSMGEIIAYDSDGNSSISTERK